MFRNKKSKAQIVVIDMVFAISLIILALFLLFKVSEINIYENNSTNTLQELDHVGNTIYSKIVSNHLVNCHIVDSKNSFIFEKCLSGNSDLTKENLSIPDNYGCSLTGFSTITPINECNDYLPPVSNNVFQKDIIILESQNLEINKNNYLKSLNNNSVISDLSLNEQTITLKVWKQ
jgi:hypothetical protein